MYNLFNLVYIYYRNGLYCCLFCLQMSRNGILKFAFIFPRRVIDQHKEQNDSCFNVISNCFLFLKIYIHHDGKISQKVLYDAKGATPIEANHNDQTCGW